MDSEIPATTTTASITAIVRAQDVAGQLNQDTNGETIRATIDGGQLQQNATDFSLPAILGIALAGFILARAAAGLIVWGMKRRQRRKEREEEERLTKYANATIGGVQVINKV